MCFNKLENMTHVTIHWSKNVAKLSSISESNIEHLDEKGFYAIYLAEKLKNGDLGDPILLYIGQAYNQTIRERLLQQHSSEKCFNEWKKNNPGFDIWVQAGVIKDAGQERITSKLFDDIECCMIYTNQPKCNTQCKERYSGRDIEIIHEKSWKLRNSSCK